MFQTLIAAEMLAKSLFKIAVLDCRAHLTDLDWGRTAFEAGHIEGAQFIDLARDLSDPPGDLGRHPLPDADRLARRFRELGINSGQQVVFCDDAGGAFAARGWWLARWLGHEAAAVLDGGLAAWPHPLVMGPAPTALPGDFKKAAPLTRTVHSDDICSGGIYIDDSDDQDAEKYTLIDARAEARYNGEEEPIDPIAGHIPGALCRPFQGNLDADGRFLSAELLKARFDDPSIGKSIVCYCGSGVTAAHNILAMRHAGLGEAALYPESWSGWITDPTRPVESNPTKPPKS